MESSAFFGPSDFRERAAAVILAGGGWDPDKDRASISAIATATGRCPAEEVAHLADQWVAGVEAEIQSETAAIRSEELSLFPPDQALLNSASMRERAAALLLAGEGWGAELAVLINLLVSAGCMSALVGLGLYVRVIGTTNYLVELQAAAEPPGSA